MDFRQVLGVSNRRRTRLVEILYYNREGTSSEQLTSELHCSLPVLLNDINLINTQQDSFFVEKDKGVYRVNLKEDISIGKLYSSALTTSPEFQILEQLLYEQHDNIGSLSKALFLSSSNTQRYLKKMEDILQQADVKLCYRPLRLEGRESVVRHFFFLYFIEKQYALKTVLPDIKEYQLSAIEKFVQEFTEINGLHKKYIYQKRMTYNVFISLWRIKNGHPYPKEELRTNGLVLPTDETAKFFRDMVSEAYQLNLTEEMMRDCLWLSFSDAIVFSKEHRELALKDNPRYKELFMAHRTMTEQFTQLMVGSFEEERILEITTLLVNDHYLFDEKGEFLTILRKSRAIFIKMVKIMHKQSVEKVLGIAKEFVRTHKIYQSEDFIINYAYLLLTAEADSLERLASQENTVHLLILSDLSPTEEEFITNVISQIVYGNFEIHHFKDAWYGEEEMNKKILTYDGLITTGSREDLPKDFPMVLMDPYVTPQAIVAIQNLVNELSERENIQN